MSVEYASREIEAWVNGKHVVRQEPGGRRDVGSWVRLSHPTLL